MPQSIDPEINSPHPPPTFLAVPEHLLTPVLTLYRQGSADASPCHCEIRFDGLTVEELDSTITLLARWFIDYDPAVTSSTLVWQEETLDPNFQDVTRTTRDLQPFDFGADRAGIVQNGVHVVEVVVGESAGFDRNSTTLPHRAMLPGYVSAVYRFVVDVHLETVAGLQCSQVPPSQSPPTVRLCQ